MTTLYNDTMTTVTAGTDSGRVAIESKYHARSRIQQGTYEAVAAPQGDLIVIGKLPADAMLLPTSIVYHDALGANSALAIGTVASPALYSASEVTTSAGDIMCDAIGGMVTSYSVDTDIVITVSGTGAITGTVVSVLDYAYI